MNLTLAAIGLAGVVLIGYRDEIACKYEQAERLLGNTIDNTCFSLADTTIPLYISTTTATTSTTTAPG